MPTYEYACTECGEHVEVVQSMSEAPLATCAVCGGKLRKVYAPIGIVFKGSGFYRTDSRAKAGASEGGARESAARESGARESAARESGARESAAKDAKPAATSSRRGSESGSGSSSGSPSSGSTSSKPAEKSA